jgi:hypothetical protein
MEGNVTTYTQRRADAVYAWALRHAEAHSALLERLIDGVYRTCDVGCVSFSLDQRKISDGTNEFEPLLEGSEVLSWKLVSSSDVHGPAEQAWQLVPAHADAIWCALQDHPSRKET